MLKYHYVYRITNKELNKHYYGVRSTKVEPKLDLGIKYFSSSKDKEFINEQKVNNSIFKYKVIKKFETRKEAINLEIKLHSKFDVGRNKSFYNRIKQTSTGFDRSGVKQPRNLPEGSKIMNNGIIYKLVTPNDFEVYISYGYSFGGAKKSEKTKRLISEAKKGNIIVSEETKIKLKEACSGKNNGMYGKKHSDTSKTKMRETAVGRIISDETKIKMSISSTGVYHSEESKSKMREIALDRTKIKCPYCYKEGDPGNMKRWHFEKCKRKC